MKLIFDSAIEYFEFLEAQQHVFGQPRRATAYVGPSLLPEQSPAEQAVMGDVPGEQAPVEQAADKPKRTRKPKAGDAPMAEQNVAQWPSSPTLAEMQAADKPAEMTAYAQSVADRAAQLAKEPVPVTVQPADTEAHAAFAEQAQAAAGAIDPAKLAERVAALGVVDPAKHLTAARMFIAAHQLPAYHQVQRDAGLPDDIIGYTDEQRTTHMAAMGLFNEAQAPKQ